MIIDVLKNIPRNHKFFCRKSQHYILGNWSEYAKEEIERGFDVHYTKKITNVTKDNYKFYKRKFISAYLKFMFLCIINDFKE